MQVANGVERRTERLEGRLLLREGGALEPGGVDEHERHVVFGAHRQPLAVGDVDDEIGTRAGRVERGGGTAEPTVFVAAVGSRGVPERTRREVRERRLVVADTVDDRHLAVVVELLHALHRLVQAEVGVDFEEVAFLQADRRAMLVIGGVAVGHDRVQPVVAAEPLEHHQDAAGGRRRRRPAGLAEHARHRADAAEQAETEAAGTKPHHLAPRHAGIPPVASAGHRLPLSDPAGWRQGAGR